jgi:hypothetical protein
VVCRSPLLGGFVACATPSAGFRGSGIGAYPIIQCTDAVKSGYRTATVSPAAVDHTAGT